jgi:hypothetical protein
MGDSSNVLIHSGLGEREFNDGYVSVFHSGIGLDDRLGSPPVHNPQFIPQHQTRPETD